MLKHYKSGFVLTCTKAGSTDRLLIRRPVDTATFELSIFCITVLNHPTMTQYNLLRATQGAMPPPKRFNLKIGPYEGQFREDPKNSGAIQVVRRRVSSRRSKH